MGGVPGYRPPDPPKQRRPLLRGVWGGVSRDPPQTPLANERSALLLCKRILFSLLRVVWGGVYNWIWTWTWT